MEDMLMNFSPKVDKNSIEFDKELLKNLIGKSIPVISFEKEMRNIFRKKSSQKLWWDNKLTEIWDGKEYHKVNYRCCPESHKARHIFGLWIEHNDGNVIIKNGWLEAI